jgi:hypothetical protein
MNTKPITVVHDDTTITYNESENRWTFTLRGRDRSAESLAKAKEYIDKPLPPEKAKPFEKIPAWWFRYSEVPKKIEVTGIAEGRAYSGTEYVWINNSGNRRKESVAHAIYPANAKNDPLINEIVAEEKAIRDSRSRIESLRQKLSPLVLPKDE